MQRLPILETAADLSHFRATPCLPSLHIGSFAMEGWRCPEGTSPLHLTPASMPGREIRGNREAGVGWAGMRVCECECSVGESDCSDIPLTFSQEAFRAGIGRRRRFGRRFDFPTVSCVRDLASYMCRARGEDAHTACARPLRLPVTLRRTWRNRVPCR